MHRKTKKRPRRDNKLTLAEAIAILATLLILGALGFGVIAA